MTVVEILALSLAFPVGAAAGSYFTFYSLLDLVMRIEDDRAEGCDRCP
jgi:hypothetical protein